MRKKTGLAGESQSPLTRRALPVVLGAFLAACVAAGPAAGTALADEQAAEPQQQVVAAEQAQTVAPAAAATEAAAPVEVAAPTQAAPSAETMAPSEPAMSGSEADANATSGTTSTPDTPAPATKDGAAADSPVAPQPTASKDSGASSTAGSNASNPSASKAPASNAASAPASQDKVAGEVVLPEGVYAIKSDGAQHMVLDVSGGSKANGGNVQLYEQNGTDAQHWRITYDRDKSSKTYGMVRIVNANSGKALDVYAGSAKNGTNVQQYDSNGTFAQWWQLVQDAGATGRSGYMLRSALQGNYVLDISAGRMVNGANAQIYTSNGTKAQRFTFVALADEKNDPWLASGVAALAAQHAGDLADGTYVISASGAVRAVLDVYAGSKANSANVQVYSSNNTGAQRWRVSTTKTADGTPWRTITNVGSGKVLDIYAAGTKAGTNVQQYASNGSSAQRWAIVGNGDGTYTLRSALGHNLVVDLWAGSTANGANVDVYTANGTAAQRFLFTATDASPLKGEGQTVADGIYVISAPDGKVIDVPSASTANGQALQTYAANGTQAQAYAITYDASTGYYHISNIYSNASLDLDNSDPLPGGKVQQWSYGKNNHNQLWVIVADGKGGWSIASAYARLGLTVSGGKLSTVALANALSWKLSPYAIEDGLYIIHNLGNGKVVDVPSASTAAGVQLQTYASNGTMAQKWYLHRNATTGQYAVQNLGSGKYLAPSGNSVVQLAYDRAGSWKLGFEPGSGLYLEDAASGLRIAANPLLTLSSNHGAATQGWRFLTTTLQFSGLYEFLPTSNEGMRLDVSGASTANSANVQVYASNNSNAQRWVISSDGDGWFAILSRNSGKALDIESGSAADGTNVQQYDSNGTKAQKWQFRMGNYGLTLVSGLGTVLTVNDPAASGSNVFSQADAGTAFEAWLLHPVSVATYLIAVDPGHGGYDGGASGNGLTEKNLTWKISMALRQRLVANGVQVYLTRGQNEYVSVRDRVVRAANAGAKAIISVHIDSGDASAHGASILNPNSSSYHHELYTQGRQLGSYILSNIQRLGISSRGYLERNYTPAGGAETTVRYPDGSVADYYGIVRYARERGMLGMIIEHGFITNAGDASKFRSDSFLTQLGQADADAIIRFYGTGGGSQLSNGSTNLKDASADSDNTPVVSGTAIMGTSKTNAQQIARYFKSKGASYPSNVYSSKGAATIDDFANIIMQESAAEGVRAEVVFCQAMHETGWLKFGGYVTADKCNFAGLGATGPSNDPNTDYGTGYRYKDVRTGIRAQVQHLKAYASTAALNNACVDQRFKYVQRGSAPTVESLGGHWAVPGNGYGESIVSLMNDLLKV